MARAFPNKYPMVREPLGTHEVVVDSPLHGDVLTLDGMRLWRERYAALQRTHLPMLFKNVGLYGGATLRHPHTQIVGLHDVPLALAPLVGASHCSTCDALHAAREDGRYVAGFGGWEVFVHDSDFTFDIAIAPPHDESDVAGLSDSALVALYDILRPLAGAHEAFNLVLTALPPRVARIHYALRFVRRGGIAAGFELLTGMSVRTATAQESAQRCRQLLALAC